jgi:hypothetical protein
MDNLHISMVAALLLAAGVALVVWGVSGARAARRSGARVGAGLAAGLAAAPLMTMSPRHGAAARGRAGAGGIAKGITMDITKTIVMDDPPIFNTAPRPVSKHAQGGNPIASATPPIDDFHTFIAYLVIMLVIVVVWEWFKYEMARRSDASAADDPAAPPPAAGTAPPSFGRSPIIIPPRLGTRHRQAGI